MSRTERKYCLISTSYMAGLFDNFIVLNIGQNGECFSGFLPMRTLCDAYRKVFEFHKRSILDIPAHPDIIISELAMGLTLPAIVTFVSILRLQADHYIVHIDCWQSVFLSKFQQEL